MKQMNPCDEIDRQAAEWAARIDGDTVPQDFRATFDAWLSEDSRHLGAYLRAVAVQIALRKAAADLPQFSSPAPPAVAWLNRRRMIMTGSIAASVLAAAFIGMQYWNSDTVATYSTAKGAPRSVSLPDGSVASLNTDTSITIRYGAGARQVNIQHGEAQFDVRKNKDAPFIVASRGTTVRAVGTRFVVQNLPGEPLRVWVEEGTVAIRTAHTRGDNAVRVKAGGYVTIAQDGTANIATLSAGEISHALAWRDGNIFLTRRTLLDAARGFSRYSNVKIVIDDPTIATLTVSGRFKTDDPIAFARAAAQSYDLRVQVENNLVRLTRK